MAAGSISDIEFTDYVEKFISLSQKTHDTWELKRLPNMPCYIMKREVKCEDKEINESEGDGILEDESEEDCVVDQKPSECLSYEYHVIYSHSYSVPVLYFNIYHRNGKLLSLEEVWMRVPTYYKDRQHDERWSFLTQQEHPLLGRPFFTLHPCHTTDLMKQVISIESKVPSNYIVSWLSAVGPVTGLQLSPMYGKVDENEDNT